MPPLPAASDAPPEQHIGGIVCNSLRTNKTQGAAVSNKKTSFSQDTGEVQNLGLCQYIKFMPVASFCPSTSCLSDRSGFLPFVIFNVFVAAPWPDGCPLPSSLILPKSFFRESSHSLRSAPPTGFSSARRGAGDGGEGAICKSTLHHGCFSVMTV